MAEYVLVDADGIDKTIKYGPLELEDPSTYAVPEGLKILPLDEARAQGYRFSEGGAAVAPGEPEPGGGASHGHDGGHGHEGHDHGHHGHEGGHHQ